MNWVSIDNDKCNECGICVLRCMSCFSQIEAGIVAQADITNCNICGHCVSLCPTDAITHTEMDMANFIETGKNDLLEADAFVRFVRRRRSHRHFKNKPIPRADLEKLIDICRYAPTGSNDQNVNILVIQDRNRIEKLADMTIDFFKQLGASFEKKIESLKAEGKDVSEDLQRMQFYADRLTLARETGINPIFYNAPAVLVFHAPQTGSCPKDNCVIASTTMGLAAMTMGLESTYIGLFEAAALGYPEVNKELNLPAGHQVYSVLILGYPALKYQRTVDRKPINVRWDE
ncbi:MAG: nitroreductase family protein [Deltaproteobacteria bacterium]|nr:nitroreductase family protein [Deltaproteobacteria bacterium]